MSSRRVLGSALYRGRKQANQKKLISKVVAKVNLRNPLELKAFDTIAGYTAIGTGGHMWDVFTPSQGNQRTQREGGKCFAKKIIISGSFRRRDDGQDTVRAILVYIKDPSYAAPNAVLQNVGGSEEDVHTAYNYDNQKGYRILYDRTKTCTNVGPAVSVFKIKKSFKKPLVTQFAGTGTTASYGIIALLVISSNTSGAGSRPEFNFFSRTVFTS